MNFTAAMVFSPNEQQKSVSAAPKQPDDDIRTEQASVYDMLDSTLSDIQDATTELTCLETYRAAMTTSGNATCDQSTMLTPASFSKAPKTALTDAIDSANYSAGEQLPVVELQAIDAQLKAKIADCIKLASNDPCYNMYDADQSREAILDAEVTTLQAAQGKLLQAVQVLNTWPSTPLSLAFVAQFAKNYSGTIAIVGTEVVTTTATTIATVTLSTVTTKFVLSTGVMYTTTPFRNYAIGDQLSGGTVVTTPPTTPTGNPAPVEIVSKTVSNPSIDFPIVLGSYILKSLSDRNWENKCPNHCEFLFSAGVGLNLGAKTADFMGGPSFEIGGFLITVGAVGARENHLLDGVYVGQTNFGGLYPMTLPMATHWTVGGGFAITYTVATP